uniref:Nocturnin n=1 Tax=Paramormyrops kingsleyae TaxID=1676925 RepID=A0A3B3SSU5_9TELE
MGRVTSRLYSPLAPTLSRSPLPLSCPEQPGTEPRIPEELLKECREVLCKRPPRLKRAFLLLAKNSRRHQPFRVMQWNILAQALGEGTDSFIQCPLDALNWAERKYLILEEILTYRPDIVCLQEVDHYFDTFRPIFCSLGYHGTFQPKPRSPCLQVEGNNGPDGCALFFRKERFQLVDAFSLRLVAMRVKTNQVAIVQKLRCRDSGQLLCVAVTHLKARSGCERLRSAQGSHLLHHLRRFTQGTRIPLLVCGDFNTEHGEDVYRRFSSSSLSLASACRLLSADGQAEPPYTTWKIRSSGESLDSVLDFPTGEKIGPDRLPSYSYPSDHLSLFCDLSFQEKPVRLL